MTTDEAAEILGISPRRVLALIKAGRLKAKKRGRDWWITPDSLEAMKNRKVGRPKKDGAL